MIEPGTLLQNRYRVIKQIGQGGMGAVYVATDERFQSTVAIKRTFFEEANLRKAFEREAHLLNRLRHPALPKVSDYFTEGEGQFLVMEYIEGSDIAELLKERRAAFPLADVLRWADELLDALEYLHTHEPPVVHRDIKPQNLKLTPRGQIILLDFGLAKGASLAQTHSASAAASVFGYSPNYAPLEQMQGTGTDTRSDLYSLAATLYHMMTGFLPVDALARAGATVKHQPDPMKPAHLAHAQVPESVSKVLRRAMSQNAALRHATAADLRAALRQSAPAGIAPRATARPANAPAAFAQAQTAPFDATVLEPLATPSRPAEKSVSGDATRLAQTSTDSLTALAQHRPPAARVSPTRIVGGIAVVLVVACIAAGSYLIMRPSAAQPAADSDARSKTRPGASAQSETDAPDATQTTTAGDVSSPSAAERANQPRQTARPADETESGDARDASRDAVTSGFTDAGGGSSTPSDGASGNPAASGAAERPALVIQNPTPAEDTRRAEEPQPRPSNPQPFPQGDGRRPPPDGGHRPPPPDGRRPPPPGHRPPPRP